MAGWHPMTAFLAHGQAADEWTLVAMAWTQIWHAQVRKNEMSQAVLGYFHPLHDQEMLYGRALVCL